MCSRVLGGYGSARGDCLLAILGAQEHQEECPAVPTHQELVATSINAAGCRAKVVSFNKIGDEMEQSSATVEVWRFEFCVLVSTRKSGDLQYLDREKENERNVNSRRHGGNFDELRALPGNKKKNKGRAALATWTYIHTAQEGPETSKTT